MKNILVAGGAGFIGSHLCRKLLENPQTTVTCVDNLCTGSLDNIRSILSHSNFKFHCVDIMGILPDYRFDEIYNLACPASPKQYQEKSLYTFKTGTLGVISLLDLAIANSARFLQSSTSEIYGDPLVHPQKEDYWGNVHTFGARSCYDESKRGAETLCYEYKKTYGAMIRIARIFNTYGPNLAVQDGRVVSNFIMQALRGDDITIYGDGTQTRSFQYIDDLINGLVKLMASNYEAPVNIGNPVETTMKQLAELVIELTGSKSNIVYEPLPEDDPCKRCPDISLAKKELDWEPKVGLKEGLEKTIAYFKRKV